MESFVALIEDAYLFRKVAVDVDGGAGIPLERLFILVGCLVVGNSY